ncbi:MAG: hypothetical protein ACXIUM_12920 [Wenzhouxiangella sp.]
MSQFFSRCLLLIVLALMLAACAGRDRQPVYVQSDEIPPLQVPTGLDQPTIRPTFQVGGAFLPEMAAQHEIRPPRVQPSAVAERSLSQIRFGPRGLFLEVQDEAESVWRRLGFSLNRGGMQVREVRAERQQYAFRFIDDPTEVERGRLARVALFWRSTEVIDHSGDFIAEIEPINERATRVLLFDSAGNLVSMDQAEHVLAVLRERLG